LVVSRAMMVFVVGMAFGAAATAAVFLLTRPASWQEQDARSQAHELACTVAQVGLVGRPCGKLQSIRKTAPDLWEARIVANRHTYCFRLHTVRPPQRCNDRS
jgi:hypothetical protein